MNKLSFSCFWILDEDKEPEVPEAGDQSSSDQAEDSDDVAYSTPQTQDDSSEAKIVEISKLNEQPVVGSKVSYNPNRYRLHFEKETKEEIERRKHEAKTVPITPVAEVSPGVRTHTYNVYIYVHVPLFFCILTRTISGIS